MNAPQSRQPRQGALVRLQPLITVTGVALIMAVLLAMLAASIIASRDADAARDELREELEPLATSLERLELAALRLGIESRGYALTGDQNARARVEGAEAEYGTVVTEYRRLAEQAGRADEAAPVAAAADDLVTLALETTDARDAGNILEAARLVNVEAPPRLARLSTAETDARSLLQDEIEQLQNDADASQRREQVVLAFAASAGILVALALIWLAWRNRRLQADAERERARLAAVVADVPGIVWEAWGQPDAASQRIDFVSSHVETMLGYSTREWLETPNFWLTIVHPEDRERAAAEAAAIFAGERDGTSQFRWIARDGRVLDVLAISSVIRDAAGAPVGMRGVTLDISERRRAEDALAFTARASEVLFAPLGDADVLRDIARLAVPALADWCVIYLLDADGEPQLATIQHADPERAASARELMLRYPPSPDVPGGLLEVLRTGEPAHRSSIPIEELQQAAGASERLRLMVEAGFRSYVAAPMIARGRTVGVLALISAESGRAYSDRDVDLACDLALRAAVAVDNQRLFNETRRERARLASIVSSIADGVYQVDEAMRLVDINPAGAAMLGYDPEALAGRDVHNLFHPLRVDGSPNPHEECAMWQAIHQGTPIRRYDRFTCADGRVIDIELNASPIELEGRAIGAVGVFQDIGERLEQERMKDDFLAFASHELRSPLTTVSGLSKWLRRHAADIDNLDPQILEAIEGLDEGADRMADIVELFLDLTRIESNRLLVDLDPVRVDLVAADEVAHAAERHPGATIEATSLERVILETDDRRIRQVLSNLVDNAVKYGGNPPHVLVGLQRRDGAVAISVRDNGSGIPEADRPHIFDRFYRGSADSRSAGGGLGIGLFVSRQIIKKLGGTITFVTDDRGTEFVVTLPATASEPDE